MIRQFPALTRMIAMAIILVFILLAALLIGIHRVRGARESVDTRGAVVPMPTVTIGTAVSPEPAGRTEEEIVAVPDGDEDIFDLPPIARRVAVDPGLEAVEEEMAAIERSSIPPAAPAVEWPEVDVEGIAVRQGENIRTLVFEEGVFTYMTNLSERAVGIMGEVAAQLRDRMSAFNLIIEGHTDGVPMSPRAPYADNETLGMARAITVLNLMKKQFNMPEDAMWATSAGMHDPPYENTGEVARRRNRTVVLILRPQELRTSSL
jgi:hypothetical protein